MERIRTGDKAFKAIQTQTPRPRFLRGSLIQLIVLALGMPVAWFLSGSAGAFSMICGAACAIVPHAFFAFRLDKASSGSARQAAQLGLAAEAGKFLMSAASFALVFAVAQPTRPGLVFVGFGVFWAMQVLMSIRLLRSR